MIRISFQHVLPLFLVATASACSSGSTGALNGEWDITTFGDEAPAPSSVTVSSGRIQGAVVSVREGKALTGYDSDTGKTKEIDCKYAVNRVDVDIALEGNSISGTFIERRKYEGSACVSAGYTSDRSSTFAFTGKRTVEAPSSDTDLNGSWELTGEGSGKPLKATMNGLSADFDPGYSDGTKGTVTITNGKLSMVMPGSRGSFTAQKR